MSFTHFMSKRPSGRKTRTREGLHLRPLNVEKGDKRVRTSLITVDIQVSVSYMRQQANMWISSHCKSHPLGAGGLDMQY